MQQFSVHLTFLLITFNTFKENFFSENSHECSFSQNANENKIPILNPLMLEEPSENEPAIIMHTFTCSFYVSQKLYRRIIQSRMFFFPEGVGLDESTCSHVKIEFLSR